MSWYKRLDLFDVFEWFFNMFQNYIWIQCFQYLYLAMHFYDLDKEKMEEIQAEIEIRRQEVLKNKEV